MTEQQQEVAQGVASARIESIEARILGCLIEKAATTPEVYPLTQNAVVVACNQKTSRDPVMELEQGAVGHALRQLEDKGLVKVVHGSRALRYEHCVDGAWTITPRQRAVLCMLMLRGPQTISELQTRCERLASFSAQDDMRETLERLIQRVPAMVICLGRASGQREDRYMHLLCGPVSQDILAKTSRAQDSTPSESSSSKMSERVEHLEQEVAQLKQDLAALSARFEALSG
jgi:uncharacterized protein YceH (UPF0502 family)